jgi:CBS domain-containing protein
MIGGVPEIFAYVFLWRQHNEQGTSMKAGDIMTGHVVSIAPDARVLEAIRLMLQKHISGLPVIDSSGTLVGMVTEGDFLRRAETGTARQRPRWLEFLVGPKTAR